MEIVKFIYLDQEVEFEVGNNNVMVNATEMAKIFDKDLFQFTKSDHAKTFIQSCLKPAFAGLLNVKLDTDLLITKQKTGTWMHRVLALKFAAWLNPDFEVWVYLTIDTLINQHFRTQREAIVEKLTAEQKKLAKKKELLGKYPEMSEYFDLEDAVNKAKLKSQAALREQLKQIKINF